MLDRDRDASDLMENAGDMRIEDAQRRLYDREYAALPNVFRGFENWRNSYIKRMFSELALIQEDLVLDVGVGGTGFTVIASALAGSFSVGTDIS